MILRFTDQSTAQQQPIAVLAQNIRAVSPFANANTPWAKTVLFLEFGSQMLQIVVAEETAAVIRAWEITQQAMN